jgi:hypothetical protein
VVLVLCILANESVDDSFENVFFGNDAVHILDQIEGLVDFIVFQVINHQVQSGFRENVNERRQHLQSVLSVSEDDQVVSD